VQELDILIIEDVPADAALIEDALRGDNVHFRTRRVETREAMLTAVRVAHPEVVLSDFNLPAFDGLAALHLVQELGLDVPFILVTGPRSEEVAVDCMKEGADDYILKNNLKRLPSAIRNALQKRATQREKARAEAALRELPRLIVEAQESERRRVARELHDSVNQILSSVKFRLHALDEKLETTDPALWREALKVQVLLERGIEEVRRISRNLRPSELDDLGLAAAVRSLCEEFAERTRMDVVPAIEVPAECPKEFELPLYRIVQEALNNVEKHARARQVNVDVFTFHGRLQACIRDDGAGFDPGASPGPAARGVGTRMGLVDMRERAAFVGGELRLQSAPGQGTEIRVIVPLPTEANLRPPSREKNPNKKNPNPAGR
jgi:signal transduction histidine kinase